MISCELRVLLIALVSKIKTEPIRLSTIALGHDASYSQPTSHHTCSFRVSSETISRNRALAVSTRNETMRIFKKTHLFQLQNKQKQCQSAKIQNTGRGKTQDRVLLFRFTILKYVLTCTLYYILQITYNFPHILKKSIDSEDGTTVVNRKRHGLPRPQ